MNDIEGFLNEHTELPSVERTTIKEVGQLINMMQQAIADNPTILSMLYPSFENSIKRLKFSDVKVAKDFLQACRGTIKNISDLDIANGLEEAVLINVVKPLATEKIINHFVELKENNKVLDKAQINNSTKLVQDLLSSFCKTEEQETILNETTQAFVMECAQNIGTIKLDFIEKIKNLCQKFLSNIFPHMKAQNHNKLEQKEGILNKTEIEHITNILKERPINISQAKVNKNQHRTNIGKGT